MKTFDAWHLPGLNADDLEIMSYQFGTLTVRAPILTPEQLSRAIAHIKNKRRSVLRSLDVNRIVDAIDAAAAKLGQEFAKYDGGSSQLLTAATGYSPETVHDLMDHMLADWQRDSLELLLAAELGDAGVLDRPTKNASGAGSTLARGPELAYNVFSGNVPGVAGTAIIRCLLVKAATLGKTASGEPVLPVLFARALADVAPDIADCLAVTYWPGGTDELESVALQEADLVVVYGGEATVASLRGRTPPARRLVVHGPGLSFGLVGSQAEIDVARDIAVATAAYDQQGCVSPHVIYVEEGGKVSPRVLTDAIARELGVLAGSQPRRKLSAEEAVAIRAVRTSAEFGSGTELFGAEDAGYTVILDADPQLVPSCLNRTLFVKPIPSYRSLKGLLAPHRNLLQSVAIAGYADAEAAQIAVMMADCGVTRVTSFEALPWPPMHWHHDGRGPLRELLTWHDLGP